MKLNNESPFGFLALCGVAILATLVTLWIVAYVVAKALCAATGGCS